METKSLSDRSATEVFEDHLKLAQEKKLGEDLERNNAEDVVLLTNYGTFSGHEGVKQAAELLDKQLPNGSYAYKLKLCHENMCLLHWTGDSEESYILDGVDSFLIEEGKIKIQTIFYTVNKKNQQQA